MKSGLVGLGSEFESRRLETDRGWWGSVVPVLVARRDRFPPERGRRQVRQSYPREGPRAGKGRVGGGASFASLRRFSWVFGPQPSGELNGTRGRGLKALRMSLPFPSQTSFLVEWVIWGGSEET